MAASRRWWSGEAGLEQRWVAPPGATFDQILKQGLEVDGGRHNGTLDEHQAGQRVNWSEAKKSFDQVATLSKHKHKAA